MDIFTHFLWTFAMYWQHPRRWLAAFIGMMPDLFSFGPYFVIRLLTSGLERGPPTNIPQYVYTLYSISHSILVFCAAAGLLWWFARDWFWLMGGWILHIIIDIPTHSVQFFPTPILWPVSDFVLSGISWATGWFMLLNVSALIGVYSWLIFSSWRLRKIKQNAC